MRKADQPENAMKPRAIHGFNDHKVVRLYDENRIHPLLTALIVLGLWIPIIAAIVWAVHHWGR